jgi:surfeit locus 1 family protein
MAMTTKRMSRFRCEVRASVPPCRQRGHSALLAVLTLAFVVLTVSLGQWQLRRAAEKTHRLTLATERAEGTPVEMARLPQDVAGFEWRRVRLHGQWLESPVLLIDNRIRDHRPGYDLVQPFQMSGETTPLLVKRGWLPARADRAMVEVPAAAAGQVVLEGTFIVPDEERFMLGQPVWPEPGPSPVVWPALSLRHFAQSRQAAVAPLALEQTSASADGLRRDWPGPPDDADKHRAYALQWYTFAVIAIGIYLVRRGRRRVGRPEHASSSTNSPP